MGEWGGVAIALLSSALGGTAAAITRYLVGNADPVTLAILRWGIGFTCLLPTALLLEVKWPPRRDWPAVVLLGVGYFGLFFVLYNIAISFTTAVRASLALATLPLHTMVVGALLGIEPLTAAQIDRCCRRHHWRRRRARLGHFNRSRRGLAGRIDHDWRGDVHGILQCLVTSVHAALKRARLSHRRHGSRRRRAVLVGAADWKRRSARPSQCAAMDRRHLPRCLRRRARLHSLGDGAAAGDADPRRQHDDN